MITDMWQISGPAQLLLVTNGSQEVLKTPGYTPCCPQAISLYHLPMTTIRLFWFHILKTERTFPQPSSNTQLKLIYMGFKNLQGVKKYTESGI